MKEFFLPLKIVLPVLLVASLISCKKDNVKTNPVPSSVEIAGEKYATIKTSTQTWTTANFKGPGGVYYDAANSKPEYGKYYSFNEVKAIVLPDGWRIPSIEDYIKLGEYYGVKFTDLRAFKQPAASKLISTTRWLHVKGNNESGFNAYPAGYIYDKSLPVDGDISEFWTSEARSFSLQEGADWLTLRLLFYDSSTEGYKFNVRFVKDIQ